MSSMTGVQTPSKAAPVLASSASLPKIFRKQALHTLPSNKASQCQSRSSRLIKGSRSSRKLATQIVASTAVAASSAPKPVAKEFKWGADMKSLGICVAIGVVTWFLPAPAGHTQHRLYCLPNLITLSSIFRFITTRRDLTRSFPVLCI